MSSLARFLSKVFSFGFFGGQAVGLSAAFFIRFHGSIMPMFFGDFFHRCIDCEVKYGI